MMKRLLDRVLVRRSQQIADRIGPFLPPEGRVLDIGSGTGHNAQALRETTGLEITEIDVTDMNAIGRPSLLFDGRHIPLSDGDMECCLMLFILHYPEDPIGLLREARRVASNRLIVLQSVYAGKIALKVLRWRDYLQGPLAFRLAKSAGLVDGDESFLQPHAFFRKSELENIFSEAGWRVIHHSPGKWPLLDVSRDLYVLERE